eukprot:6954403-Ditylum_brightwellii.AAC.3
MYHKKDRKTSSSAFTRLFMFQCNSDNQLEQIKRFLYIMETCNRNTQLFQSNIQYHNAGQFCIGCTVRICCPLPMTQFMRGDIPLVETHFPLILLSLIPRTASIPTNTSLLGSEPVAFVYNATEVTVNYFNFVAMSCLGNLCNTQRVNYWNNTRGCGCYGMNANSSNLAIQHQVDTVTSDRVKSMLNFSSMKFSLLYPSHMLPWTIKVGTFHASQAYFDLKGCISKSIKFTNDNGGFIVRGWLKRCIINDKSLLELESSGGEVNHVDSSEINYHFVQILPTNCNIITEGT